VKPINLTRLIRLQSLRRIALVVFSLAMISGVIMVIRDPDLWPYGVALSGLWIVEILAFLIHPKTRTEIILVWKRGGENEGKKDIR